MVCTDEEKGTVLQQLVQLSQMADDEAEQASQATVKTIPPDQTFHREKYHPCISYVVDCEQNSV